MKKTVALHGLGCKVNSYEMEQMTEKLLSAGYAIVPFEEYADYYIVNTCSVTNIADRKSRQMLHRARKTNPDGVVIAVGCYVDTHGKDVFLPEEVDIALKNSEKEDIAEALRAFEESRNEEVFASDGTEKRDTEERIRKFLKVQDGCNMFCSYCIIPFARGRIRSRSIADVTAEIRELVIKGYREFVITGIHLSSFGMDRPEDREDLISLIKAADQIPGVERIRLGSLEPRIITESFARELKDIKSLCPHFHLSLQSGSDSVLKRMNRHYTTGEYRESVDILRRVFDKPAMTTDVIVGFPGETEKEFQETYDFLKETGLYETHLFPYSRRKGTVADRMDGQLSRRIKHERLEILKELDRENRRKYEDSRENILSEVLFEEDNEGYTREYIRVKYPGEDIEAGKIVKGRIKGRTSEGMPLFYT